MQFDHNGKPVSSITVKPDFKDQALLAIAIIWFAAGMVLMGAWIENSFHPTPLLQTAASPAIIDYRDIQELQGTPVPIPACNDQYGNVAVNVGTLCRNVPTPSPIPDCPVPDPDGLCFMVSPEEYNARRALLQTPTPGIIPGGAGAYIGH